jgi:hypothetical protein
MKTFFLIPILAVFSITTSLAQSPILSFAFDGTTGSNGKMIGRIGFEEGIVGKAGTFDGSSWVEVPHSPGFDVSQWTISAWASPQQEKCSGRILEKGASSSFWLTFYWGCARFGFHSREEGVQEIDSSTKFKANEWHHVTGTFDGKVLRLYVDGKLEAMRNTSAVPNLNKQPLVIGAKHQGIAGDCFIGALDEVSLYDRPLSDTEIMAMYQAGQ